MYVGCTYIDVHLWFVCTERDRDGEVVIANITTLKEDSPDRTCVVQPEDHPWVTRPSVVLYQRSRLLAVRNIEVWFNQKTYQQEADASADLMARIRRGALDSEFTSEEVRQAVLRCPWKP